MFYDAIGPMIGTHAVLHDMSTNGGGAIVNMGSIDAMEGMGWVAFPNVRGFLDNKLCSGLRVK